MPFADVVRPAGEGAWLLRIWAQPGAKKDAVAGFYQGRLKIRLGAPAVDDKANRALVRFVAASLALKERQVRLRDGRTGRQKTLLIEADHEPRWDAMVSVGAEQQ